MFKYKKTQHDDVGVTMRQFFIMRRLWIGILTGIGQLNIAFGLVPIEYQLTIGFYAPQYGILPSLRIKRLGQ